MHRELKPENLLVADTVEGPLLKVSDFGLSATSVVRSDAAALQAPPPAG